MGTSHKQYQPTIVITRCSQCESLEATACHTTDSFERPQDWYCSAHEDGLKIQGYVEWYDKIKVPEWCPLRVKRKKEEI